MHEFLNYVAEKFELIAFCSGDVVTCSGLLDYIEKDRRYFEYRFFGDHALFENANFCIKYYDFLLSGERSLENIIILESGVAIYSLHIFNGIPVRPYNVSNRKADNELIYVAKFLTDIEKVESIQLTLGTIVRSTMLKWQGNHGSSSIGSEKDSSERSGSIDK